MHSREPNEKNDMSRRKLNVSTRSGKRPVVSGWHVGAAFADNERIQYSQLQVRPKQQQRS